MAASSWEDRAHDLRTAAEHCRDDATELMHLSANAAWTGLSGDAFRTAVGVQAHSLHLVARELEVAADLVAAHGRAVSAASTVPAAAIRLVDKLLQ